jgi:lantibiotic modifying enzyme
MLVGCGWPTVGGTPLAGYAHGAAGIAHALLALAAATGDDRFAVAARAGLAYERSLFDERAGNWPDLRLGPDSFMVAWCHGAAGIGLGRLASVPYLDDGAMRLDIDRALAATQRAGSGLSHALCHGDLGNLEVLLQAGQVSAARRWAAGVLASARDLGWQCATPFGLESVGLMTGLAGIGYGLLRACAPDVVPSLLTLECPKIV